MFFLFLLKNIDCGYSLEPPHRGGSNEYPTIFDLSRSMKNIKVFIRKFSLFGGEIFYIFEKVRFRNVLEIRQQFLGIPLFANAIFI